ncbi:hypothetical protein AOB60_01035 [Streptomyces noursei]|uniref:Histidine kinase/HSP90-like ATPase domain-containing protein n=1 Tax=Streptomyces noursei TaxID=1971 RepID=A0A2N8PRE4_STRNR|nr:hypothetical protein AOB60_01035 [Streptomyces noursei]
MQEAFRIAKRGAGEPVPAQDASRVGEMRAKTAQSLADWGLEHLTDDVLLVVSEMVTNSVVHSHGTQVWLRMDVRGGYLHIEVQDEMPGHAVIRVPTEEAEAGRGLQLVRAIAMEHHGAWGTKDGGATTWCKLKAGPQ